MKTYYIPTSSLNFSNILSSESISPKAFYEKRGFGSPHWFTVEWNRFDTITLLYDKPFHFEIPKGDLEDHPLMIEIQTKKEFTELQDGIFYTDRTIYLNPWNTKMFFFSEKHKRTALNTSNIDLDVKMLRLYEKNIKIETFDKQPIVPNEQKASAISLNEKAIEDDMRINKLKGMLYGYYIGAYLSSEKDDVAILGKLREVRNIFASILSDEFKKPTHQQDEILTELFNSLNRSTPLHKSLAAFLTDFKDSLLEDLRSEVSSEENKALKYIDDRLKEQFELIERAHELPNVNDLQIDVADYPTVRMSEKYISKEYSIIFNDWIENVLIRKDVNGKLSSSNKQQLADHLTISTKELCSKNWENSEERVLLNNMRKYIVGNPVEIVWGDDLFSSLTAVLVKGNEWDECLRFMEDKGMADYRLAFSLYGVIHGFANLSRDFTDQLLDKDSSYIASFYREIHRQLHKEEIESPKTIVEQPKAILQKGYSSPYPLNPHPQDKGQEILTRAEQTIKKNKKERLADLKTAMQEFGEITEATLEQFFNKLQQRKDWHTKQGISIEPLKKLRKHFGIAETAKKKPLNKNSETLTLSFGNTDSNASSKNEETLPDLSSLAKFDKKQKNRLKNNWKFVCEKHNDKKECIDHFVNLCAQEGRGEGKYSKVLYGKFDKERGDMVKAELYKHYGIREN